MKPSYIRLSRFLSLILRHRPEVIGIQLDRHGWADVDALIQGVRQRHPSFDRDTLEEIVRTDDKQRYAFSPDGTKIRANQGHSVHVDLELAPVDPPDTLWHGSARRFLDSIRQKGLLPGARLQVHLSADYPTAVKVGARHGQPVVFQVNCRDMTRDGYLFYQAENGVWLTDCVPPQYLRLLSAPTLSPSTLP